MYSVDDQDRVAELRDLPQASVGAPLPVVLADEHRLLLAYVVEEAASGSEAAAWPSSDGEPFAVVAYVGPVAHFLGPPNDEAFTGHPLAARGLRPYGAYEVSHSSWVRELERRNRVHPRHRPERYAALRHFVVAFHDSTFECVARGYAVSVCAGSPDGLMAELQRRWSSPSTG